MRWRWRWRRRWLLINSLQITYKWWTNDKEGHEFARVRVIASGSALRYEQQQQHKEEDLPATATTLALSRSHVLTLSQLLSHSLCVSRSCRRRCSVSCCCDFSSKRNIDANVCVCALSRAAVIIFCSCCCCVSILYIIIYNVCATNDNNNNSNNKNNDNYNEDCNKSFRWLMQSELCLFAACCAAALRRRQRHWMQCVVVVIATFAACVTFVKRPIRRICATFSYRAFCFASSAYQFSFCPSVRVSLSHSLSLCVRMCFDIAFAQEVGYGKMSNSSDNNNNNWNSTKKINQ